MFLPYVIAVQLVWIVIRKTYAICQFPIWLLCGTWSRIQKNYRKDAYESSVQVLNILGRHKFCVIAQPSGPDNFLMTHKEFVDPEYVLKDHITLYYINKDEAVFVEAAEGVDVTQSRHGAFLRYAQFNLAKRLIIMPIDAFNRLGEKIGHPKAKIMFLCNTARCGSTLVTQVFEETGSCIAYSEPDAINAITQLKGVVTKAQRDRILKNCINLMCKPFLSKEIKSCMLKLNPPTMIEMPHILEMFPECTTMFIYRDGLECSRSVYKLSKELPSVAMVWALGRHSAKLTKLCVEAMGIPADNYEVKLLSGIHLGAIVWSVAMKQYLEFWESGMEIAGLRYEDLIRDTTYAYQKVFKYCGLPFDAKAVDMAMGRDSQRDTPLSLKNLSKHKPEKFTPAIQQQTDLICDHLGIPHFPNPYVAPGTITNRELNRKIGK